MLGYVFVVHKIVWPITAALATYHAYWHYNLFLKIQLAQP